MIEVETNHGLPLCRRTVRKGKAAVLLLAFLLCSLNGIAQTPTPSPSLSPQELQVPPIAPEFHPAERPLPELGRVGVNMDRQRPLTLRDALALALENNKDIEVARHNVKIAEFDLTAARGVYDPRLSSSSYYERIDLEFSQRWIEWHHHAKRLHRNCATRRSDTETRRQLPSGFFVNQVDDQQSICGAQSAVSDCAHLQLHAAAFPWAKV